MTLTGSMLIGDADVRGRAGEVCGVDPSTGAALDPVYGLGDGSDVDRAVSLAWRAFPVFRATSLRVRQALLSTIADNVDELGDVLVARVVAETGVPEVRVRGELARTTTQLRLFASVAADGRWLGVRLDSPDPERLPLPKPDLRQRKVPLGPVAVFAASNFPLAFSVAGGDTASALAALTSGALAGAALDVFADEPNVPPALLGLDNVVLLPHIASGTTETREAMGDLAFRNLHQFVTHGTLLTPVP